jgi:predicted LPLAT superfamily acyltransferase
VSDVPEAPEVKNERSDWLSVAERGSVLGIRFFVFVSTAFGRSFARFFLRIVAFYYVIFAVSARRASRDYLTRVNGTPPPFSAIYTHVLRFAEVALDRVFIVSGKDATFVVTRTGREYLTELAQSHRGAILLGAHLGSFEAMRGQGDREAHPINVLGYFKNARMINAALQKLNPRTNARVIGIDGGLDFVLAIKERVERGEMIALLGDRIGPDKREATVTFMGGEARFPTGAYLLASILKCPIYLTFGLYRSPDHYDLFCEPFAMEVTLPRKGREEALREYTQKFATRLEHFVRMAPDNWFNFYDFWKERSDRS